MRSHQPPALLTSSLQYGIVSRSFPLTGKVLRGYLDASGTGLGVGNNNPNLEFTPNVTACAMANEGGTARIIWGFRDGQVAVMTAPKAMAMDGGGRAGAHAAKLVRCQAREDHEGAVLDAAWDTHTSAAAFITGGADARIKLWDAKSVRCIWTSTKHDLVPDPIVKVAFRRDGIVVGAARNGDITIHTGLSVFLSPEESPKQVPLETRVPCPLRTASTSAAHTLSHEILALHLTPLGCPPAVLAMYKSEDHFYRISLTSSSGYQLTRFGDACAPITAIMTSFSRPGYEGIEGNVIYTGDQLGSVALYNWDAPHTDSPISPMHKFFAHALPITALAQSPDAVVLVIGSADGGVKVFDALSFDPLRAFAFSTKTFRTVPVDDETEGLSVERIIVENDTLVAFAGARVLAWKSGGTHAHGHLRHSGKRIRKTPARAKLDRGAAKYHRAHPFLFIFVLPSPPYSRPVL
jgi:WD40 repeat protein